MVFLTRILQEAARHRRAKLHSSDVFGREPYAPDNRWKRRRLFMLTAHLYARKRNVYRLAHRALMHSMKSMNSNRYWKPLDQKLLTELRIEAGSAELDFDGWFLREALTRSHVHLSDEMLANLAIWEPRSFRAVVGIAADKAMQSSEEGGMGMLRCGPGTDVIGNK